MHKINLKLSDILNYADNNFNTTYAATDSGLVTAPFSECFVHKAENLNDELYDKLTDLYYKDDEGYLYLFLYSIFSIINQQLTECQIVITWDDYTQENSLFSERLLAIICTRLPAFEIKVVYPALPLVDEPDAALSVDNSGMRKVLFLTIDEFKNYTHEHPEGIVGFTDIYIYDAMETERSSEVATLISELLKKRIDIIIWNRSFYRRHYTEFMINDYRNNNSLIIDGSYTITNSGMHTGKPVYKYICRLGNDTPSSCYKEFYFDIISQLKGVSKSLTLTTIELEVDHTEKIMGKAPYKDIIISDTLLRLAALICVKSQKPVNFIGFSFSNEFNYLEHVSELVCASSGSLYEKIMSIKGLEPNKLYFTLGRGSVYPFILKSIVTNSELSFYKLSDVCDMVQADQNHPGYFRSLAGVVAPIRAYPSSKMGKISFMPLYTLLTVLYNRAFTIEYMELLKTSRAAKSKDFLDCLYESFYEYIYTLLRTIDLVCFKDSVITSLADVCLAKAGDEYYICTGFMKPVYKGNKLFVSNSITKEAQSSVHNLVPSNVLFTGDLSSTLFRQIATACGVKSIEPPETCMGRCMQMNEEYALLWLCSCCNYNSGYDLSGYAAMFKGTTLLDTEELDGKMVIIRMLCTFFSELNCNSRIRDWETVIKMFSPSGLRALPGVLSPITIYGGLNKTQGKNSVKINTYPIVFSEVKS